MRMRLRPIASLFLAVMIALFAGKATAARTIPCIVNAELRGWTRGIDPDSLELSYLKIAVFDHKGEALYVGEQHGRTPLRHWNLRAFFDIPVIPKEVLTISVVYRVWRDTTTYGVHQAIRPTDADLRLICNLEFSADSISPYLRTLRVTHTVTTASSGLRIERAPGTATYGHPLFKVSVTDDRTWYGAMYSKGIYGVTFRRVGGEWESYQAEGICFLGGWHETEVSRDTPAIVNDIDAYSRDSLEAGTYQYRVLLFTDVRSFWLPGRRFAHRKQVQFEELIAATLTHDFTME